MEINLIDFNISKVYQRHDVECYLDPIRKKLIPKTPEEDVRQSVIHYLITQMNIPIDMIEVEVPMSYFRKAAKGRSDIIVYSLETIERKVPVLVIECKAPHFKLTDNVFDQVYRYEEILASNAIMVTNGTEMVIECWKEDQNEYVGIKEIPAYRDLISLSNLKYLEEDTGITEKYKRLSFAELDLEEHINFYKNHFGKKIPQKYWKMVMNLNELLWDLSTSLSNQTLGEINVINDIGIRYTSFGNMAGFDWTGDYRSLLIQDLKGTNQIVSLAIMHGYLIVAFDDYKKSHNSLQYNFHSDCIQQENEFHFHHNGRLALGNKGSMKHSEVINFTKENTPELVVDDQILIGSLQNTKAFSWEDREVRTFIGELIKYGLIRDEFRKWKLTQLEMSKN